MSIAPGLTAVLPVNAPGLQAPGLQAPASASPGDFASALRGSVDAAPQAPIAPATQPGAAYRPGAIAPRNTLGDQVLGGLEKLGRSVEAMQGLGAPGAMEKSIAAKTRGATDLAAKSPVAGGPGAGGAPRPGPQPDKAGDPVNQMRELWATSMRDQRQSYSLMCDFELISQSSQSMLKSLKSLLTQGGG